MSADEDLDDLDHILDDFTSRPTPPPAARPSAKPQPQPQQPTEDDLSRQMAALLSSLGSPPGDGGEGDELTKLLAQIMRAGPGEDDEGDDEGEGEMDEAGFEQLLASLGQPPIPTPSNPPPTSKPTTGPTLGTQSELLSFEETINRTISNLESTPTSAPPDTSDPLAQLLASLNIDPSDLDLASLGLGSGPGGAETTGGDFSGVLDGMMKQLMTKEILHEPLLELAEKYPAYLSTTAATLPAAQREKYTRQHAIVTQILQIFDDASYSDSNDVQRGRVTVLMTQMQDLGSPPDEIMGDMPEGLDFGGEGCSIM